MSLFDIESTNPIAAWRKESLQSRSGLAAKLCVSAETIRRWEAGAVMPSDENVIAIAKLMGRKPKRLYEDLMTWQAKHGTPLRRTAG